MANFEKKIAEWSLDSRQTVTPPSADCETIILFRRLSKNGKSLKKVAERSRESSEVTQTSADCQTTFFNVLTKWQNFEKSR